MLVMDDRTVGIIYALKQGKYAADMNIRKFMSQWSKHNWDYEDRESIENLLRHTIIDYLMCCDNKNEINRYFSNNSLWVKNEYYRMISFLWNVQVKDDKGYVNNMRDNPYSDFEVFKEIKV